MPRPRKSARTLELAGSFDRNPARKREDLIGQGDIGKWNPGSSDPAAIWSELCSLAPAGILTASDRLALEIVCRTVAEVRASGKALSINALGALILTLSRFGLTPSGRQSLDAPAPPPAPNRFAKYA